MGLDHKHYDDYVDVRGDGRIVMYKRNDHKTRPKWMVRIKLSNTKGYLVKSTRTAAFLKRFRTMEASRASVSRLSLTRPLEGLNVL